MAPVSFKTLTSSLIKIVKRIGLRLQPCRNPGGQSNEVLKILLLRTEALTLW